MSRDGSFVEIEAPCQRPASARPTLTARLPRFMGGPEDAVPRFASLKALVVGSGSVGTEIEQHLARWQIQELAVVDPKIFKTESLLTHSIPAEAVGEAKACYAATLAKR